MLIARISMLLVMVTLALFISACHESPKVIRPEELRTVNDVQTAQLIDEELGNCPINEFEIPGEKLYAKGGVGGLAIAPNPSGNTPAPAAVSAERILEVAEPSFDTSVAILVVDDYNGGVFYLDRNSDEPKVADLDDVELPSDPVTQAAAIEELLDNLELNGQLSHGALVYNHVLQLLLPVADSFVVTSTLSEGDTAIFSVEGEAVYVVAVDTEDFNTVVIAERIEEALVTASNEYGLERFAINLSFGLVPCSVLEDFEASKKLYPTFETYLEAVAQANSLDLVVFREELTRILTTPVNQANDPLRVLVQSREGLLQQAPELDEIIFVAAAGNYALSYALFPAAWPEFIGSSSYDVVTEVKSSFSNVGEVMAPGAWFTLSYVLEPDIVLTEEKVSYAGTSFSAPAVSVFSAFDLMRLTPRCAQNTVIGNLPALAFGTGAMPTSALDQPLKIAVSAYCSMLP